MNITPKSTFATTCLALIHLVQTIGLPCHAAPVLAAAVPKLNISDSPIERDARPAVSFAPVVQKVSASVVSVNVTKYARGRSRSAPEMDDLFRRFFGPEGMPPSQPERPQHGLGSGVIISEDGYILTNTHVVEGADEIKVGPPDERTTYDAKVIGTDPQTDIAIIKIEAKKLPAITVTDSDKLEVGDIVLAIGNPFGVGQTVTSGIASAKRRGGMGIVDYEDFIQTDASINPGNSGGALVDAQGRLVGINTAILSRTGGNQGIGFAVPVNLARYIMEEIISKGKVTRGYLGVMIQAVTPELAKEFKLPEQTGALVGEVTPKSPAEEAGLKEGDVIVEFQGKPVTDSRQLRLAAAQTPPGTKVSVKVIREGKEQSLTVKLGELPVGGLAKGGAPGGRDRSSKGVIFEGVELGDLNATARREFSIPNQIREGALIVNIEPNSPAASAGLQSGDLILEINRQPVGSADKAIELSQKLTGERALLRVWSQGGSRYVVVDASKRK